MIILDLIKSLWMRRRRRAATERLRKFTERSRTPTSEMQRWALLSDWKRGVR